MRAGGKQMLRNPIAYDTCHDEYNSCNKTMFAFLKDKHPTCQYSEAWLSWGHHFENSTVATMTWLTAMEYLCHKWPRVCTYGSKHFPVFFPHASLITGFVTRLKRRVLLMKQELHTLPEHLSSPPVFSGVRVAQSLVLCVCFFDRCLSFCPFPFGSCIVCSSSIYVFWFPLWYLQTLHARWQLLMFISR